MNTQPSPRRRPRLLIATAAAITCLFLHFTHDGGLPAFADDLWRFRANGARVAEFERVTASLDERLARSNFRTERRAMLLDGLKSGQLTLADACHDYAAVLAQDPHHFAVVRNGHEGYDDTEKLANYFLFTLADCDDTPAEITSRLTNQFRETFDREPSYLATASPAPAVSTLPALGHARVTLTAP